MWKRSWRMWMWRMKRKIKMGVVIFAAFQNSNKEGRFSEVKSTESVSKNEGEIICQFK
jgi:hypothetical protein